MAWSKFDIPGGDWRGRTDYAHAHYTDRLGTLGMASLQPAIGRAEVEERRTVEQQQIMLKAGWRGGFAVPARLSDAYRPSADFIVDELQAWLPEDEAGHRHDFWGLAEATHVRLEGRIFHPDGWWRRWDWMPHAYDDPEAYSGALMELVRSMRIPD